ncbi:WD40 repeat-containing protein [Trypanosoma conorhini]|uniref:WD40 repeat-containing protein n=1 Tax=Trypanosoma conorhini TaxID=83891 RepID=A0A422P0L5_9TRYP|nr:WD40 repeat-containing protein [Trypanosoma conorhini]RNF11214.1 WD40 repeat-containing protein [Trypanosoma conorhini]
MSLQQLLLQSTLPSAPSTTRAVPTPLSAFGDALAYGSGNRVVVREVREPGAVILGGRHTSPVTAVRISPSGKLVASGDQNGNVLVWARQPDSREVLNTKQLQGPVRDIAWTHDEERVVLVGDGKSHFATVLSLTGNTIGTINGHTQNIVSCDMRGERPYRIVTGGADALVGFYEGVPFKFKCNVQGHKDKVTCVRYSPDMETIATVSRSPEIVLLDGKTAELKGSIATGHTGTIYSVAWSPDGSKLATASADKSVKIFDVATGVMISSCVFGADVMSMQQGVAYTPQGVFSISLGGELALIGEDGKIKGALLGHQGRILLLHLLSNGTIVSVGVDRALMWRNTNNSLSNARKVAIASNVITAAACCGDYLYLVSGADLLRCALPDTEPTLLSREAANVTALAITEDKHAVLLSKNGFVVLDASGRKVAEEKLDKFDGTSAASHGDMVVLGGDALVKGYRVKAGESPEAGVQFAGHHAGVVACVAFAKDGQRVASGDATRNIFVWSPVDGSVLYRDLVFHTLRVTSLAFAPHSSARLLSGSMDASLIVWDLDKRTRKTEDAAHCGGVSAVAWTVDGTLLSGGADFCLRQWNLPT